MLFIAVFLGVGLTYAYFTATSKDHNDIQFANVSVDFVDSNDIYTNALFTNQQLSQKIRPGEQIQLKTVYVKNTGEYDVYAIYKLTLNVTKKSSSTADYAKEYWYNLDGVALSGSASSTTDEATFLAIDAKKQTNLTVEIPYELDNSYKQASAQFNLEVYAIQSLLKENTGLSDSITACQLILKNKDQQNVPSLKFYLDGKLKSATYPASGLVKDISVDGITTDNTPGWFYDADCTEFAYDNDTITENTVLYTKTATLDKLNIITTSNDTAWIDKSFDVAIGDVVIPRTYTKEGKTYTITQIGKDAFHNGTGNNWEYNDNLTSIVIPQTIIGIGDSSLYGCDKIKKIGLPEGMTYLSYAAMKGCLQLTSIVIPSTLTRIDGDAFYACRSVTSVTFVDIEAVTYISSYVFGDMRSLKTIELPPNITCIYNYTFDYCISLTSIKIPSKVNTIGSYAFGNCNALTQIVIPKTVTRIDANAFQNCSNLNIFCEASSKPSGWSDTWNSSNRPVTWGYTGTSTTSTVDLTSNTIAILPSKQKWDE